MATDRTERFNMLLTPEEVTMLRALADHKGVTPSDYLRLEIRAAWMRCAWCGAEPKLREKKGGTKANVWRLKADLHVCPECGPSVLR